MVFVAQLLDLGLERRTIAHGLEEHLAELLRALNLIVEQLRQEVDLGLERTLAADLGAGADALLLTQRHDLLNVAAMAAIGVTTHGRAADLHRPLAQLGASEYDSGHRGRAALACSCIRRAAIASRAIDAVRQSQRGLFLVLVGAWRYGQPG